MDTRDAVLFGACPLVPAPVFGKLQWLTEPGKRLVAARDGLYLEARSPVLHWLLRVSAVPMPYGEVQTFLSILNGPAPLRMLHRVREVSLAYSPKEVAFGIEWLDDGYRLVQPDMIDNGVGHVTYRDRFSQETLVLDIHSHGAADAYFSKVDDVSDLSRVGPYLAAVIAPRQARSATQLVIRAVCSPYLIDLDLDDPLCREIFQ